MNYKNKLIVRNGDKWRDLVTWSYYEDTDLCTHEENSHHIGLQGSASDGRYHTDIRAERLFMNF